MSERKGSKNDAGKVPLALIPIEASYEMGKAFAFGAKKYGKWNYKKGIEFTALASAAERHLKQFMSGVDYDEENINTLHLGHALASIAMLVDMYYNNPEMDDRYKGNKIIIASEADMEQELKKLQKV